MRAIKKLICALIRKKRSSGVTGYPLVVVDVGCRWGVEQRFLDGGDVIIYGFDPDAQEIERLGASCKDRNVRFFSLGLAKNKGYRTLYKTKELACSSLYRPNKYLADNYPALDCIKEVGQARVCLTTLDKWASENNVDYIDYIKIDTQGSELDVLKGGKLILPTVRYIEVEVEFNPIYDGQPLFSELDMFLRKYGFELWKFKNLVHYGMGDERALPSPNIFISYDDNGHEVTSCGGQVFWADAIYVKKDVFSSHAVHKSSARQIEKDCSLARQLGLHDLESRIMLYKAGRK